MKFPSLLPPEDWSSIALIKCYYKITLPYQIRKWFRMEVRPLFCRHTRSYNDINWGHTYRKCGSCHKVLDDLRKDPK